jgi:hypothetical protein
VLSVPPSTTHPPPTIPLHHIGMYRPHQWPLHTVISDCIVGQGKKFQCEVVLELLRECTYPLINSPSTVPSLPSFVDNNLIIISQWRIKSECGCFHTV